MRKVLPISLAIAVALCAAAIWLLPASIDAKERTQVPAAAALPLPEEEAVSAPLQTEPLVDTSTAGEGYISVTYNEPDGKYKVLIEKDGERYVYDLVADNTTQAFPLQMGDGVYTVGVMKHTGGNEYTYLTRVTVTAAMDSIEVYLAPIQLADWTGVADAAAVLTEGTKTDREKLEAIYTFVVSTIEYDDDKINTLSPGYIPDPVQTLREGSGLCYDFASLTASLLRASGVPARLAKGYAETVDGYHAWNEVYIDSEWITIDASYDAQMRKLDKPYQMEKDEGVYTAEKIY